MHPLELFGDERGDAACGNFPAAQPERDVFKDPKVREERIGLEEIPKIPLLDREVYLQAVGEEIRKNMPPRIIVERKNAGTATGLTDRFRAGWMEKRGGAATCESRCMIGF